MPTNRSVNEGDPPEPIIEENLNYNFSPGSPYHAIQKSCRRLASSKTKVSLIKDNSRLDIFSSVRPRVGLVYDSALRESQKKFVLESCRIELLRISLEDAEEKLESAIRAHEVLINNLQNLPADVYMKLLNFSYKEETRLIKKFSLTHQKKVDLKLNSGISVDVDISQQEFVLPSPQKKIKHRERLRERRRKKTRLRRLSQKVKKCEKLKEEVESIKSSNLVQNFSDCEVPDVAYLYLALGSTFAPVRNVHKHDHVFDTKVFCRKLSWRAVHHANETDDVNHLEEEPTEEVEVPVCWTTPKKLLTSGRSWPNHDDNRIPEFNRKLSNLVEATEMPKRKSNLTHREVEGLKWCKEMMRSRTLYITRADKGGSIYLFNSSTVDQLILDQLNNPDKFTPLPNDPRKSIRSELNSLLDSLIAVEGSAFTLKDRLLITGKTEKGGQSHHPDYVLAKPHTYPLFKGHKLSPSDFDCKVIPPTRMVTASVNGPVYRLGSFLDGILRPVSLKVCQDELVTDTTHFLQELETLEGKGLMGEEGMMLATLDVDALYPNIRRDLALEAIEDALRDYTLYPEETILGILRLVQFCLSNSVVHYRGGWFRSDDGVPTGGPESGSIANIYVKWILDKVLLVNPRISQLNLIVTRRRFLDDLFILWLGTVIQFELFKTTLNEIGRALSFTLKGEAGNTVNFLDVTISNELGGLSTTMFVKPTDSARYLHRRSDHSLHMFKAIPFSQFRRAVVICTGTTQRDQCLEIMMKKFIDSGYKPQELITAKERALALDRAFILSSHKQKIPETKTMAPLTYIINHDPHMASTLKSFIKDNSVQLKSLIGDIRIIIAERKNPNTASLLFGKSSFSNVLVPLKDHQRCDGRGCKSCKVVTLPHKISVNGTTVNLDFTLNCKSECCVYLAVCKHCDPIQFYFGQTSCPFHMRNNGHRGCFDDPTKFENSALSNHILLDHDIERFGDKLNNFHMGIVKEVPARLLDRVEDFFIYSTRAVTESLNRIKVSR